MGLLREDREKVTVARWESLEGKAVERVVGRLLGFQRRC